MSLEVQPKTPSGKLPIADVPWLLGSGDQSQKPFWQLPISRQSDGVPVFVIQPWTV